MRYSNFPIASTVKVTPIDKSDKNVADALRSRAEEIAREMPAVFLRNERGAIVGGKL